MRHALAVLFFAGIFAVAPRPAHGHDGDTCPPPQSVLAPLNLNQATVEQLDELPGIGPALAGRIVAWRDENGPFQQIEQLRKVKGIGERTLARLRPLLSLE